METPTDMIEQFKNQLHHIFSNLGNHIKELSDLKKKSREVDVELRGLTVKQKDLNNEILRLRKEIELKNEIFIDTMFHFISYCLFNFQNVFSF